METKTKNNTKKFSSKMPFLMLFIFLFLFCLYISVDIYFLLATCIVVILSFLEFKNKKKKKRIILIILLIMGAYYIFPKNYNDGDCFIEDNLKSTFLDRQKPLCCLDCKCSGVVSSNGSAPDLGQDPPKFCLGLVSGCKCSKELRNCKCFGIKGDGIIKPSKDGICLGVKYGCEK